MANADIVIQPAPAETWDALLREFPDATVYHSLAWLETVSAMHNVKIVLARADRDGRCVGVWPYLELRKGPLRIIGSPLPGWSTAYMGPLIHPTADSRAVLDAFLGHKLFRNYAYFACKVVNGAQSIDLSEFGFIETMKFSTYRVDLAQTEQMLWDRLKSECRSRIRKAMKLNVELREERDDQFVDDYWLMSIDTYSKSNLQPPHTKEFVSELWRRLKPLNRIRATAAYVDGQRIAMLVLINDHRTVYYWGGAAFNNSRQIPAHNLLHWQAILDAKAAGLRYYDMLGTIGGPGRFKSTFNPEAVDIATHWERSPSKLLSALKNRYERYLRRRRRIHS